jgi:hypothetical protein
MKPDIIGSKLAMREILQGRRHWQQAKPSAGGFIRDCFKGIIVLLNRRDDASGELTPVTDGWPRPMDSGKDGQGRLRKRFSGLYGRK